MTPNTITSTRIYNKLVRLEKEFQRLKKEAYAMIPQKLRGASRYQEKAIVDAVHETSNSIWREQYGKKIARIR